MEDDCKPRIANFVDELSDFYKKSLEPDSYTAESEHKDGDSLFVQLCMTFGLSESETEGMVHFFEEKLDFSEYGKSSSAKDVQKVLILVFCLKYLKKLLMMS